jgi:purine-nucleoside phosphorylase
MADIFKKRGLIPFLILIFLLSILLSLQSARTWMKNDESKLIFKPRPVHQFGRKRVLYIPWDTPQNTIRKALKERSIKERKESFGQLYLLKNQVVFFNAIGAPLAVIGLERFIASGTEEILILGFCGALCKKAKIADPVLITQAYSEEGTSRHYFPRKRKFRPSSNLLRELKLTLEIKKLPYVLGDAVTTDAPFRETKSWLARNRKKGIGYVDMEASSVFALADFHAINAAALMLVSDNLTDDNHKIQMRHPRLLTNIKKYFVPFLE